MDDPFLMRGFQSPRDLIGNPERLVKRQRAFERLAFDQLHDKIVRPNIERCQIFE